MRATMFLAWSRLRHRPGRWLLVSLGVLTATVLPVLAESGADIAGAQAVRYGIENLDPGQRSVIVSYPGIRVTPAELAGLDRGVRERLGALAPREPRAQMLLRRISDGAGGTYFFGAADGLASGVRVTSGRAPASCEPTRCEVVVVGEGTPQLDPQLGLVIVGRAVRTDPLLLTGTFDPGHDAPLLLADGVARAAQLESLDQFQRSYGWVAPIDLELVGSRGVADYLARSAGVGDALRLWRSGMVLTAPDDVLRAEDDRARRSARRFTLLGGSATALLLGFAAIGAIGLRRDHTALVGLVRQKGATRRVVRALTVVESAVPVIAGTAAGMLAGAVVAGWRAAAAGMPAWSGGLAALRDAASSIVVIAGAAVAVVAAVRAWPAASDRRAWRAVDLAIAAGAAIAGLAVSRGVVSAAGLAERVDPLLLALPVIVVTCGGLLVGRAWPAVTGLAARTVPRAWLALRLGLLGALRRPLRPVATAAFLAAATGIAVFAGAYRATLEQGAVDQAAFAVPVDARISTGANLERPLDVAPLDTFAAAVPGGSAHPVLRTNAGVPVNAAESFAAEVVGVDPAALPRIRSWEHVAGGPPAPQAARLIATPERAEPPGLPLPPGADRIDLPATGDLENITVVAYVRSADGRTAAVDLRRQEGRLAGALPALPGPLRLIALAVDEEIGYATRLQHRIGEGSTDVAALGGRIVLGAPPQGSWAGWGSAGASVTSTGVQLTVDYRLTGARVVVRAGAGEPREPIPVLADPVTAARAAGGLLPLVLGGSDTESFAARVVGVLPRFPTVGTRFLVADFQALSTALDTVDPGTGSVQELWLWAPDGRSAALDRAMRSAPYDRLKVQLRSQRQAVLAADPLARGAAGLLTGSALVTLLVAAVALALLVVAERRDESAELYAWESDGVGPRTLRAALFVRAAACVCVAVPGGLLVGLGLARLTTALVSVTAVGSIPNPPLALAVGPLWMTTVLALGVALGLAAAGAVAASALREKLPRRPEGGSA